MYEFSSGMIVCLTVNQRYNLLVWDLTLNTFNDVVNACNVYHTHDEIG